jgi:cytochrome P450
MFRKQWWRTLVLQFIPFSGLLERLPIPGILQFYQSRDRLDATVYRIINGRRERGEDQGDLLSMLLLAQDEEGDGGSMTDLQVRDEVMTIFLAGHETTASSLTWTWYLLSQHPKVVKKLHSELESVLAGKLPTVEDVGKLKYTRMIFAETLRLYPPIWLMNRQAIKDYKIDSYVIPAKSVIHMSPYLVHRDPKYYPNPHNFEPERWDSVPQEKLPKFAYFPFGGGPRHCLGEQFAWMEAVLIIAAISQHWEFHLVSGHRVEPQPLVTLRPKYGMQMRCEKRKIG